MNAKRLFHAGGAGAAQRGGGFLVGDIAGDENDSGGEFGAMGGDPGVDLGAIDASGGPHVGDDAMKIATLEQSQGVGTGFGGNDGVSVALQDGAHQSHDGRFVFNQKHWRVSGFSSCLSS